MSLRFFSRRYLQEDRLPRLVLTSATVHLAFFYLFFGDPFSIFAQKRIDPPERKELHVQLLSSDPSEEERKPRREGDPKDTPVFPPEKEGPLSGGRNERLLPEDDLRLVDATPPPASPLSKTAERKLPHGMTGPQDCMLKVVGMVCPDGDFKCIAEYEAFCATLPE